jgi:hypothetical protein
MIYISVNMLFIKTKTLRLCAKTHLYVQIRTYMRERELFFSKIAIL